MSSLPSFGSTHRRRKAGSFTQTSPSDSAQSKESPPTAQSCQRSHRAHAYLSILAPLLHLISLVFLILVIIGNIHNQPVLRSTYFLKLDLSHIIPRSVPNAVLINSIARTLGLHNFYQV